MYDLRMLKPLICPPGYAARLDGGELSNQVRPMSQKHQVLPGPDGPALCLVPDHGESLPSLDTLELAPGRTLICSQHESDHSDPRSRK